jgi:speckle-type POZ protein
MYSVEVFLHGIQRGMEGTCDREICFKSVLMSNPQESVSGAIRLEGDDLSAAEAMLRFMYTFDYDASGSAENSFSPMVFNVKVYSIADKYDVPALKSKAEQKFEAAVAVGWDMDDFPDAIAQVYNSTPSVDRGLREIVTETACKHVKELLLKPGFRDVLDETVGFASDIAQLLAESKNQKQRSKYRCPSCRHNWEAVLPSGGSYHCIYCGFQRSDWSSYAV